MHHRRDAIALGARFVAAALAAASSAAARAAHGTPERTPAMDAAIVTGTIVSPDDVTAGPPATIVVRIEDVSRADAPATVVASLTLEDVPVPPPAGEAATFAIPVGSYDPRLRYGARVHVDRDGDGQVGAGDLVSTSHHPVLTLGGGTEVSVPVSEVTGASGPEGALPLLGEAGILRLHAALTGVLWQWQGNVANDGAPTLTPDRPEGYTVAFLPEGRLAIQADCNRAMGTWSVAGAGIDLAIGGVTKRGCPPGSLMQPFLDALDGAVSYAVHGGNLALALPNGGVMLFAPVVIPAERATPAAG